MESRPHRKPWRPAGGLFPPLKTKDKQKCIKFMFFAYGDFKIMPNTFLIIFRVELQPKFVFNVYPRLTTNQLISITDRNLFFAQNLFRSTR